MARRYLQLLWKEEKELWGAMSPQDKRDDLFDQLKVVSQIAKQHILDVELKAMAGRLVEYHGIELARLIASLPERQYFPACTQIEAEIRKILGREEKESPGFGHAYRKGDKISLADIENNERDIVVGGQDPKKARGAADMMRISKRRAAIQAEERIALQAKIDDGGRIGLGNTKTPPIIAQAGEDLFFTGTAIVKVSEEKIENVDSFSMLDFEDPIKDLEEF